MANQAKAKKEKSIEETLWDSANKLRGTVESSEYKHVVLGLIFLKFASDKFEERRKELIADGKEGVLQYVEYFLFA
jgi:type I restriction enzyme M protein